MKVRQLEVFQAVYETGSVTAAAARLHCTQPAVSVALAKFETQAGVALFDRSRGRFVPTAEGDALYVEVERGLLGLDRIRRKAHELREGAVGHLHVAVDAAPSATLLPQVVAEFQQANPEVVIDLWSRNSREIVTWAAGHQIDVGLVELPVHAPGVAFEPVTQACVCIMPEDHPLAALDVVGPEAIGSSPVVGVHDRHPIDLQLEAAWQAAGLRLHMPIRGYYFSTLRSLVRCGAGVAVVDALNGTVGFEDGVVARPFEPTVQYETAIVYPARPGPGRLTRAFIDALRAGLEPFRID